MSERRAAFELAERVAESVLYEGYVLYPYRWSAIKNRRRWTFGMLFPRGWCERREPSETWRSGTDLPLRAQAGASLRLKIRFLQAEGDSAVRREIVAEDLSLDALHVRSWRHAFRFGALQGRVDLGAEREGPDLHRLRLEIANLSLAREGSRDELLPSALAGTHAVLGVHGGEFLSRIDPPEDAREAVTRFEIRGLWPVVVGGKRRGSATLAAPIILEDDPRVAPQSHGDLFDCTEIEELLRLRVLTLTEAEKDEMRRADERCRRILDSSERLGEEDLLRLHGTLVATPGVFRPGAKVRVRPKRRADILDTVLDGRLATIVAVERDLEDRAYLAVVFDEDPGREWGLEGRGGHRFFYHEDEVELL